MEKCCGQEKYSNESRASTKDRRSQLIEAIKELLEDTEHGQCRDRKITEQRGSDGREWATRGRSRNSSVANWDEDCKQYRKRRECTPPTITNIGLHETRPTSMYDEMKYANSSSVTYIDATAKREREFTSPMPPAPWELPRTPSQELRAGTLYSSCDCKKRNGLQHDCQRWECGGRPECVATNPGPCCLPSFARKPWRGDRRCQRDSEAGSTFQKPVSYCDIDALIAMNQSKENESNPCQTYRGGMRRPLLSDDSGLTPKITQIPGPCEVIGVSTANGPLPPAQFQMSHCATSLDGGLVGKNQPKSRSPNPSQGMMGGQVSMGPQGCDPQPKARSPSDVLGIVAVTSPVSTCQNGGVIPYRRATPCRDGSLIMTNQTKTSAPEAMAGCFRIKENRYGMGPCALPGQSGMSPGMMLTGTAARGTEMVCQCLPCCE